MKGFMFFIKVTVGIILLLTIIAGNATTFHYTLLVGYVASITLQCIKEKM